MMTSCRENVTALALAVLLLLAAASPGRAQEQWSVLTLVRHQAHLHPSLGVQDVVKLLYQAHFGVGHLLEDSTAAREWLEREMADLGEAPPAEPPAERISTDGRWIRVNLRPWKALGGAPSVLVRAMAETAAQTIADTAGFLREWNEFRSLVRYGLLAFPADEVRDWDARVTGGLTGPVHHSEQYLRDSRPAYRVCLADVIRKHVPQVAVNEDQ